MMEQKRKVHIWADADEVIGYGHFVRSLALANMIKDFFNCTFYTQNPTEYQKRSVLEICRLVPLPADNSKFYVFLKSINVNEIVVLDNFFFSSQFQKDLKNKGCKLICFGTNDKHYYADVVVNYILGREDFSAESYTRYCLGFDWVLLREPFLRAVRGKRETNYGKKQVVITFGGTDQFELTEKAVFALRNFLSISEIHIIATDVIGVMRIERLRSQGVNMHIGVSAQEIVEVFYQCDVAIVSASSVVLEALACQIPVIVGYYVDNQHFLYDYLISNQYASGIGNMRSENFPENLYAVLSQFFSCGFNVKTINHSCLKDNYISLLSTL